MITAGKSDIGRKRESNQDCFRIATVGHDAYLAVVCDGMGGAAAGDIASRTAAECFTSYIRANYPTDNCRELMLEGAAAANALVYGLAEHSPEYKGMGTTLVAALVTPEKTYILNIGDSRLYRISGNDIVKVTRDHTLVQMLVDRGEITVAEAEKSPAKHYITKCIGVEKDALPDIFEADTADGEILVLCSDGLHGQVKPEKIKSIINAKTYCDAIKSCEKLIDEANKAGGNDNVTAVIVKTALPQ